MTVLIGELRTEGNSAIYLMDVGAAANGYTASLIACNTLIYAEKPLHEITVFVGAVRLHTLAGVYLKADISQFSADYRAYLSFFAVEREAYVDTAAKRS